MEDENLYSILDLKHDVVQRKKDRHEIRQKVDDFCKRVYGIQDFYALADQFFSEDPGTTNGHEKFRVCLARQIPTANVEHAACDVLLPQWLSDTMGMDVISTPLSFWRDTYVGMNAYKKSLVNLPCLFRGRNGPYVHHEKVVDMSDVREGRVLSSITTMNGESLPSFHRNLRISAFGVDGSIEMSLFLQACLREALKNGAGPGFAYRNSRGVEEKVVSPHADEEDLRPPADWFYQLYLMLFLDGDMALLSTVDDCDEVSGWFTKAIEKIVDIVGFEPLIVSTPVSVEIDGIKSDLIEFPSVLFARDWKDQIAMPPLDMNLSVYSVVKDLERRIIELV